MSVTETINGIGQWNVTLKNNTPQKILDSIQYFGTICVHAGRVDVDTLGDNILDTARYAGQLRSRGFGADNKKCGGAGLLIWLGDADKKGYLIEEPITFTAEDFNVAFETLLPPTVAPGNIVNLTGLYDQVHVWQSRRQALDYLVSVYPDAEYRINPNFTVDAGEISDLYVTDPKAIIARNKAGVDYKLRALRGRTTLDADIEDFTTRTVLLRTDQSTGGSEVTATAEIDEELNPYKDFFGNPVQLTRIIQEDQTDTTNAPARAQLQQNRFSSPRDSLKLTTVHYDIKGDFQAGDYVWVYDPESKLVDPDEEQEFYGEILHPMKLRCTEMTWPIEQGSTVAYRDPDGVWIDLTPYVVWETGDVSVVVGGYNRSLTGQGASTDPVGSIPTTNSTVPDKVTGLSGTTTTYQSQSNGETKAQINLEWDRPLNVGGTIIQDGGGYYVRYRTSATAVYEYTHQDLSQFRHNAMLGTFESPVPFNQGSWVTINHPWGDEDRLFLDLTPGIPYDFQVAAFDNAIPPNVGEWSDTLTIQTRPDTTAPSTPAAPEIYASKVSVQLIHKLGKASGGEFNLELDTAYFELHTGVEETFTGNDETWQPGGMGTMLGKVPVNAGMITGEIPLVATVQMTNVIPMWYRVRAVDFFGNKSPFSPAVQMTAELWDDAHIDHLTVSKVTAGEISANWIMSSVITTDITQSHARVDIWWGGIRMANDQNYLTMLMDALTGAFYAVGTLESGMSGRRVVVSGEYNSIIFYPESTETRFGQINGYIPTSALDSVAIDMRASFADVIANVARVIVDPRFTRLTVSDANDTAKSRAFFNVQEDLIKGSINWLPEDGAPDDGSIYANGGYFLAERGNGMYLGHATQTPSLDDNFLAFTDAANAWFMKGLWQYGYAGDGKAGMFVQRGNVSSGVGAVTFTYGSTQVGSNAIQGTWGTDSSFAFVSAAGSTTFTLNRYSPTSSFPAGSYFALAMATNQ